MNLRPVTMKQRLNKRINVSWKDLLRPGTSRAYFRVTPLPNFQADERAYDPRNAWWLAEISRLIYRQNADESGQRQRGPTRNDYLLPVGLREVRFFRTPHVQWDTPCPMRPDTFHR